MDPLYTVNHFNNYEISCKKSCIWNIIEIVMTVTKHAMIEPIIKILEYVVD